MMSSEVQELISDFSRFYILILLYEGPAHGYGIISKFRERVGKRVSPSLVYPFLKQLEQRGLVTHITIPIGKKERKIFDLSDEGKEVCSRLFKRFSNLVSIAIEPSLEVCAHCGCKVYEGDYREVINGKDTMFCCIHCANSYRQTKNSS